MSNVVYYYSTQCLTYQYVPTDRKLLEFSLSSPRIPFDTHQPPDEQQQCIPRALLLLVGYIWKVCSNSRTIPVPLQDTVQLDLCRYMYNVIKIVKRIRNVWHLDNDQHI